MEDTSSEKISEALKLLEEAARQKGDALKNIMADKYTHLRSLIMGTESSIGKSLSDTGKHACQAVAHAREVGVEKAREIAGNVDKSVHNHPWPYIGVAVATGGVLGYFLGRGRK